MKLQGDGSVFPRPLPIDNHWELLTDFTRAIHFATTTILSSLSTSLGLPAEETLESYHKPDVPSPDLIRLLKYQAQPMRERGAPQTPHTDLGSLTVLFTRDPGLQIWQSGVERWAYVLPQPGKAIINVGDALALMTNHLLHSVLHRVGPLPNQAMEERYSFAYLLRAEDRTPLTGLKSPLIPAADASKSVITSGEWLQRKFGMLRLDTHQEKQGWVLTGEFAGETKVKM